MQKIIRSVILFIVSVILLNSIFFIVMGVYKSVEAYILFMHAGIDQKPGVMIAEALDSFMIALFFIIFSVGIAKLFLPASNFISGYDLTWLKVENFSQLKYILWEVLLTTMFIFFAARFIIAADSLDWNMLIVPASILMLSIAYKLLKQSH